MFVMKNHGFKRKYVYGGAGIFDSLAKLFTSGVANNWRQQRLTLERRWERKQRLMLAPNS